ncbi:cytochrome c [Pusillimonas sp. DMV24BSW_D]|jgi:cytochrome c553|uniref:Cytochrome C n=1 Tax=Neopusillimonas maritima TaxID=2026239 RepID=A0A3A1YWI9_9BURK|nr:MULTISPECIES: cytochrome c [Alcaligenaceae]MAL01258.1 cytochrome C [Alcaligenaceae bacterium]MBF23506.1 cytochrome C [Pusillimonas sp.]QIM49019.1 cytochrome c [Pusillimonas sp. DMV24BSW_D]RIY41916.1 cytochrome C [Neopusillimonas maritima]|tara:strand:+ start:1805 stop:2155 length:351 start_codon:yes stop_codon:yes gene_type:complete
MKLRTKMTRTLSALAVMASCGFIGQVQAQESGAANAKAAVNKVSMCIGCHGIEGYKSSFPEVYHVPKIAGQNAEYIVAALKEYASGARSFPTMEAIAKSLSEQDMADLAAYYSNLK